MQTVLKTTQQNFADCLTGQGEIGELCVNQQNFSAAELMGIYRHNYYHTLIEALKATYGCVCRLVGDEFFNHLAKQYINHHPLEAGFLRDYGDNFSTFIGQFEGCSDLPYLQDVATLEWLYERCYHAASVARQPLSVLASEAIDTVMFNLMPSSFLLQSDYPLVNIWCFDGKGDLDINQGGQSVLIYRHDFAVTVEKITTQDFSFLSAIGAQKPLDVVFKEVTDSSVVQGFLYRYFVKQVIYFERKKR